jgi:Glycosyl transferases group 1
MSGRNLFFYCFDNDKPTGGQKDTYFHVDALNDLGYNAFVVHEQRGYRLQWFKNDTRVIDMDEGLKICNPTRDYLVVSEGIATHSLKYPLKKVIFNKSIWKGFAALGENQTAISPYRHSDVVAVLTMSEHNSSVMRYAYPELPVFHVVPFIDTELFTFRPLSGRKPQIAYATKAADSVLTLYHIVMARATSGLNALRDWNWVKLEGKSEQNMLNIFQESELLVFLSSEEGLGRTVLEAMACGCPVVGFKNGTIHEILPTELQFEWGDFLSLSRFIEDLALGLQHESLSALVHKELETVQAYARQAHRQSISRAWKAIFSLEHQ